ncbi:radical SAM/SPASM domain-containing protein [Magnetospirillum aberrantis]|uniref:Radical SAM protein n=1 Tax=Magnetospirillum aberrantis SpK TaxID=908842 RepID=A0A7C9UZV5_9PROT|nr:radical SAM protein [Magnetospirillum aberrantis]NFV81015.1 radical SAM protein [Magnetospirillum aberrantis SpK]
MLRLSRLLRSICLEGAEPPAKRSPPSAPVVIWNLTQRCNLHCRQCYAASADRDYPGELTTAEALDLLDQLHGFGVRFLILSGGEPLMHPDLFTIAAEAKRYGFHLSLSSNGTLMSEAMVARIAAAGFDYVGVSLDGLSHEHDFIRGKEGAFAATMTGIRRCRAAGVDVGLRTTLTSVNAALLPEMLGLCRKEGVRKFYLSHLNFAGRGKGNSTDAPSPRQSAWAVDQLIEYAWATAQDGTGVDIVTGNNDSDAVRLLDWTGRVLPERHDAMRRALLAWGGNSCGCGVANIDPRGNVHPDTMWGFASLGNVREHDFARIWTDGDNPLLARLRQHPRAVSGRCASCSHLTICNGNSRVRAYRTDGDLWGEDPGCHMEQAFP